MLGNPKTDGYQHGKLTLRFTPFATFLGAVAAYLLGIDPLLGAALGAIGCVLGLFVEPDLDQQIVSTSEYRVIRLLGPLGCFWVGYWMSYALAFGGFWIKHKWMKHRGMSHWPVIGTLTRVFWLIPAIMVVDYVFLRTGFSIPIKVLPEHLVIVMIGLILSDFSHFARDFWGWEA